MTTHHFRLIVSDLDGTLLDPSMHISRGAEKAIQAVQKAGFAFSLASGRGFFIILPLMRRLKITHPCIASGGALILDPPDGECLYAQSMEMQQVSELVAFGRQAELGMSFHEPNRVLAEADDNIWGKASTRDWLPEESEHVLAYRRVPDLLASCRCPPVRVDMFGPREQVAQAYEALHGRFSGLQVLPMGTHLEITRAGVNKGSALRRLAEILEVPLSETLVIGDDINDTSMFQQAGLAVAMGNATQAVKEIAGVVAPTNAEGGLAWALREFVLGK